MHYLPGARRVAGFLLIGMLAGCSGGSGTEEGTRTEISTNAIAFRADGPSASVPAAQVFTATFGKDIAHLAVVHSGDAIASTTSVLNGRTAQITVVPSTPSTIGPGLFSGAVAVTGYTCADTTCSKLSAGSTSTVAVSFQISPAIQHVAPYVATSGVADTVIIRGLGFLNFNVTGVRFGDTAATAIAINTAGTEIAAAHPALAAGSYTVHVDATNHDGAIPSTVTLQVQDPIAYSATTLSHPVSTTALRSLVYDAERHALLTVTDTSPSNPISRYEYGNGAWSAPTSVAGGFLDVALNTDGTQLYSLTGTTLVPTDPVTLALGTAVTAPSLVTNSALKNVVIGNDNRAFVTSSYTTSGATGTYIYYPELSQLVLSTSLNNATPVLAGNGNSAIVIQGDPTLTADVASYVYLTTTNSLSSTGTPTLRQNTVVPAVDRAASRIVLNGLNVYDASFALLGTLPSTTAAVALKSNGSRAYAYDTAAGGILTYDISVDRDEAAYVALGAVTPLAGDPGTGVRMTITPDGGTLFIGGSTQIVVQPTPAL